MNKKNILTRSASGIFIGLVFIVAIFLFRPLIYVLLYSIAALMLFEWHGMTKVSKLFNALGQIIIPLPIAALLLISYMDQTGWLLFTFFTIIWSVDVMAMFGGKLVRGHKLAPELSPNKTISGLIIGVLSAVIIVNLLTLIPSYDLPYMLFTSNILLSIFCLTIGIAAQASDLLVSYFKRKFNVKDTGTIIPGHGGVLDRFDSIILTAPLVVLYFISHL
jgi:phosphatidate cytidylyltransferase